jgi:hypothetical protein
VQTHRMRNEDELKNIDFIRKKKNFIFIDTKSNHNYINYPFFLKFNDESNIFTDFWLMMRRREFAIFLRRNWFFLWIFTKLFFISSTFFQSVLFRFRVVTNDRSTKRSRTKTSIEIISLRIAIQALINSKTVSLNRIKI